jgi:hypothetical protein
MELLDRYITAVNEELDSADKVDLCKEIRANILDELDEHEDNGADTLKTILERNGSPAECAQKYAPRAPLIAGENMPLFKTSLKHAAAIVLVFSLIKTVGGMLQSDSLSPIRLILQTLGSFLETMAIVALVVTIAFYYLGKGAQLSVWREKQWSIDKLPHFPQARVKLSDTFTDLSTASFLLLILWTGLWMTPEAQSSLVVSLVPELEQWRIILTIVCVASGLFALYRLSQPSWKLWSLGVYIVDHALFAAIFLFFASQPQVFAIDVGQLNENLPQLREHPQTAATYVLASIGVITALLGLVEARKFYFLYQAGRNKV